MRNIISYIERYFRNLQVEKQRSELEKEIDEILTLIADHTTKYGKAKAIKSEARSRAGKAFPYCIKSDESRESPLRDSSAQQIT
jgi:DNA primase large subunit